MAEPIWYVTKDGDRSCIELYERHYSCYHYADGRERTQCVGPGAHIMLRTADCDAMFVWRKYIDDTIPKQDGVECAVFRNEAPHRYQSSELIRQADAIADRGWPGERLHQGQSGGSPGGESWTLLYRGRMEALRNDKRRSLDSGANPRSIEQTNYELKRTNKSAGKTPEAIPRPLRAHRIRGNRAMSECNCGATAEGKWADVHAPDCPAVSVTREIEDLIAHNCRAVEGWPMFVDGIENAAAAIYARFIRSPIAQSEGGGRVAE